MLESPSARPAIWLLASLALFFTLDQAETLLSPIILGLVFGVVLTPVASGIEKTGVPAAFGAFLTVIVALILIAAILFILGPYVSAAIARAPQIWDELRTIITDVQDAMRGIDAMREEVADAMQSGEGDGNRAEAGGVEVPTVVEMLLYAPAIAARSLIFVGTLYFFLLVRIDVYEKIAASSLRITGEDLLEAEREVARYFLTITMINLTLGTLVALAMWAIGMPSPIVWGVVAALANFILYLGPAIFATALAVAGIAVFDGAFSLLPPAIFIGMNMVEGQFVTPSLVGRQMAVNPLAVFLSLCCWLWLWGPLGGIIAIPLLVWALAIYRRRIGRSEMLARAEAEAT